MSDENEERIMETKNVAPNSLIEENGELLVIWTVNYTTCPAHAKGEKVSELDRVSIPAKFSSLITQARNENKMLRISYNPYAGPLQATNVRLQRDDRNNISTTLRLLQSNLRFVLDFCASTAKAMRTSPVMPVLYLAPLTTATQQ